MAATRTDITVEQGVDFSQALDITDTTGRTYAVTTYDRFGNEVDAGMEVDVTDGTTITLTMSDDDSDDMTAPAHFAYGQRKGKWGTYIVVETVTATGVKSRPYEGDLKISLEVPA